MATEILAKGQVLVRRPNRAELLKIRSGAFDYNDLIDHAEKKIAQIEKAVSASPLPNRPDLHRIEHILVKLRTELYLTGMY